MNIEIRLMQETEYLLVNSVYNNAYGNIRPLDHFEWEFIKGPWGKAIYVIAVDLDKKEDGIIGTQAGIPIIFTDGNGNKIMTAKSEDTFVHPDYRGHKLFDRMYELLFAECAKVGIKYIWGFTYARKPFLKLGFQIPFETLQGVYITSPKKAYNYLSGLNKENKLSDNIKIWGLCYYNWLNVFIKSSFGKIGKNISEVKLGICKNKKSLINSVLNNSQNLWSIDQTEEYLNWRIRNNPYPNNYLEYYVLGKDSSDCNADFLFNKRSEGFVYLEEFLFNKSETHERKLLFTKMVMQKIKSEKGLTICRFWGFDTNKISKDEISILKSVGFTFIKKGTAFVWKDISSNKNLIIEPNNIILSRLYTQGNR